MNLPEAIGLSIGISRGILRSRKHRRMVMAGFLVIAALFCLLGITLFDEVLGRHLLLFLGYWTFCVLAVGFALLFALFDLLMVRKEFSERMSSLKEEYRDVVEVLESTEEEKDEKDDAC